MAGEDVVMHIPKFGIRGGLVVLGGFLVHLALGSYYMFGNYSPYIISYLRNRTSETEVRNVDALWVTSFGNVGNIFGMVIGGILDRNSSVIVTYFCVKVNLDLVTFTYGFTSNFGIFIAYIPPVQTAMKWLPRRPTLASGLVVSGFGLGTFVFSSVVTDYINPHNLSPDDYSSDSEEYFTQSELLDRVPNSFLVLGFIYFVMQLFGIACLTNPPAAIQPSLHGPKEMFDGANVKQSRCENPNTEIRHLSETTATLDTPAPAQKPVLDVIKEALRTRATYILWLTILCNMFAIQLVSTVYKAYGQNFINDDHFLALSVAIPSIFNCIGRPLWGLFNDRFGYKITMWTLTCGFAVVLGTFSSTEDMDKAGFMTWICMMFLFYSGNWSAIPATFAALFGTENTGITFGLGWMATSLSAITAGVIGVTLRDDIGWHGLFYLSSGVVAIAFIATFFFNGRNRFGEKI